MLKKVLFCCVSLVLILAGILNTAAAQGVTTAAMSGIVTDKANEPLIGASVVAVHTPTGTQYGAITGNNGRFNFQNVRVGGPYTVTVSYVGFAQAQENNIMLTLGENRNLVFVLSEENITLGEVTVTGKADNIINAGRTGAATNISKETISAMPTISRSINDFTRLTPQSNGRSFVGQDSRNNNITVDGSIFNSSFGLTDQPGGRTGSTPISLDAIEQIQVNIAPFDVRQAGFTGAGVNAVTRSGTNEFTGSVFYNVRNENFVGRKAKDQQVNTTDFVNKQYGFRLGGPIIKNKLFFFVNGEMESNTSPATPWVANRGQSGANVTRVLASDLDSLSNYLRKNFGYETGPYEGYNSESKSYKFLAKLDYNISQNHKASLRYNVLDSQTDMLLSNSSSLGFGNRRTRMESLNFQNSNYMQLERIHSIIGELNSTFGNRLSNNFIAGYTYQNEDRGSRGDFFPLVEILKDGQNYTTFGFEPFTPNNKLSYKTFQLQDNLTYFAGKHVLTAGFNVERMEYKNVFFPGSQSVYVYNSLEDFYTDANGYLANNNRTSSDVSLRRFQLRFSGLPGGAEPVQPTQVTYSGIYAQDEYTPLQNLRITAGVRADVPVFDQTGFHNPRLDTMTFRTPDGQPYSINTAKLPDPKVLVSPRLGFNWDVTGEKTTQVRGGTGLFTGRPVFVWISNQIGNNGVLTGFESIDNTTNRPFNPNPAAYIPDSAAYKLPKSFEIAATDPNFRFPQVWRNNIAIDQKLPFGVVATLEAIYSKDINGIGYFNANQKAAEATLNGPDNRPVYQGSQASRINSDITSAVVLTNSNKGYAYSLSGKLEKQFDNGFYAMSAYNFGEAKNTVDAGSIAFGSWAGIQNVRGGNYADLAYSGNDQRHRWISALSYKKSFAKESSTQISLFFEGRNQGRYSYTYTGDFNNDGITNNDLIYIPGDKSEMNFETYTTSGKTFTKQEQEEAFERFIAQDSYLKANRGKYAERNGALMPWVFNADLSIIQEYYFNVGGKKNTLQFRADIINVGNLLNNNWGVSRAVVSTQPLRTSKIDAEGKPVYRMNTVMVDGKPQLLSETYRTRASIGDVWQAQFGIRYIFN